MVKIKKIQLNNFRNFKNFSLNFDSNVNILYGNNGSGKTNILESISLLSKGRGIRNSQLLNIIHKEENKFLIKSLLEINKSNIDLEIFTSFQDNKYKKNIKVNDNISNEDLKYLNSSLSFLIFIPEMERLFQSSPTTRRNFIDRLIFSYNKDYNKLINKYKKNILERNKILQNNIFDKNWINIIENEISILGQKIYELRHTQLTILNKQIKYLNKLNKYQFEIDLKIDDSFYNPKLDLKIYLSNLFNSRDLDKKLGGTKVGPHKSDISAQINGKFDASQLSTGQQKTVILMIILAQCNYLVNEKKIKPIILLDEICSHLDSYNRKILLDLINSFDIQFFLTGTEKSLFSFISTNVHFCNITNL
ncbi:DNA replication and repair protein RecF [Pelagibacteraceae bacterium]|nr:DNA replication and repair protein RecF [Pelagibacteraceae bacterium]